MKNDVVPAPAGVTDGPWPLEPDAHALDTWTAACVALVREHLLSLPDQPASDLDGADDLRRSFDAPAPATGTPLPELLARLRPAIAKSLNTAGPGYLAFIPGGGIYSAALADYVATAVNRYVGVHRAAPVLAQIETTVIAWLARWMGYPATARGILTSGGSLSMLTAVVTARVARLPEDFLRGTIYFSEQTHLCVRKAARIAGFPISRLRALPVDERLRLIPSALERAIAEDRQRGLLPFLVVANAGTTNTGAVDPMPEILAIARRHDVWVHADAAYGGFFRLAKGGDELLAGMQDCDSISLDPHKGLFLPYGTGCLLVRDGEALKRPHEMDADYLRDVESHDGAVDFTDLSPELSRDFRGLRLWLPIQLHGVDAFRAQLDEKLALARWAHERLAADPHFEIVDAPQLSLVAFRLRSGGDRANAELLRRVNARRRVFLSSTMLDGKLTLRLCILSFRTHRDRLAEALDALQDEALLP